MAPTYASKAHLQLQIETWSNSIRTLKVRGFTTGGPIAEDPVTAGDKSRVSNTYEIHGQLEGLSISPLVVPVRRGECYVRATLLVDGEPVQILTAAYLTDSRTLTYPEGIHEGFTMAPGLIRSITGTNPAAGVGLSESVPTNARWKLTSIRAILTNDATVANRTMRIDFEDPTNIMARVVAGAVQTASNTYYYEIFIHASLMAAAVASEMTIPMPEILS